MIANLRYDRAMERMDQMDPVDRMKQARPVRAAGHVERVVVLALDGVYPFELGIPSRIFGAAEGWYEVLTCTVDGGPVRTETDFSVTVDHGPEIMTTADTVVIAAVTPSKVSPEISDEVAAALAHI